MRPRRALVALLVSIAAVGPASARELAVIVNAEREARLTRDEVAQIYLKRRRFWDDGEAIVAVNRESGSRARRAFVQRVFGDDARNLEGYWNRQYFRGVLPPATLASDEAVKRFVARERRAIGYIAVELVDASVRVVLRLEAP